MFVSGRVLRPFEVSRAEAPNTPNTAHDTLHADWMEMEYNAIDNRMAGMNANPPWASSTFGGKVYVCNGRFE